jgi:hypothetical protein
MLLEVLMIELTEEQARALETAHENPAQVLNPRTREVFVLVRQDIYQLMKQVLAPSNRAWDDPKLDDYERFRKQP